MVHKGEPQDREEPEVDPGPGDALLGRHQEGPQQPPSYEEAIAENTGPSSASSSVKNRRLVVDDMCGGSNLFILANAGSKCCVEAKLHTEQKL